MVIARKAKLKLLTELRVVVDDGENMSSIKTALVEHRLAGLFDHALLQLGGGIHSHRDVAILFVGVVLGFVFHVAVRVIEQDVVLAAVST